MVLLEAQRKEKLTHKVRDLKYKASALQKKFRSELNIRLDAVNIVSHQSAGRAKSKQPWEAETSQHSSQRPSLKPKTKKQIASSAAIKVNIAKSPITSNKQQMTNIVSETDYTIGMSRALEDDLNESQEKLTKKEEEDPLHT